MADSIPEQRAKLMQTLTDLGAEYTKTESEVNAGRRKLGTIERKLSETRRQLRELELKEHAERTKVASK